MHSLLSPILLASNIPSLCLPAVSPGGGASGQFLGCLTGGLVLRWQSQPGYFSPGGSQVAVATWMILGYFSPGGVCDDFLMIPAVSLFKAFHGPKFFCFVDFWGKFCLVVPCLFPSFCEEVCLSLFFCGKVPFLHFCLSPCVCDRDVPISLHKLSCE